MNIAVLVLLRAWSILVRKFRVMVQSTLTQRGHQSQILGNILYLGVSLLGSAWLIRYLAKEIDPMTAVRKQTAAKAKEVEARLGAPMKGVSQHELMAVECVIAPDSIDITIDDIGGLDKIIKKLMTTLSRHLSPTRLAAGAAGGAIVSGGLLREPKGILLYGPPGTGKTMLAKAIAKHVDAFFLAVKPSDIQSKYYGETNKAVAGVFKLATRLAKAGRCCIIFVDEVDALLGKRKDMEHEVSLSLKTEFMSLWDGIDTNTDSRVVILGATNRMHELDEAVLRRFTLAMEVKLPDAAAREDILQAHLRRHTLQHSFGKGAVDQELLQNKPLPSLEGKRPLQWIAEQTDGYSGADLHELAVEAAQNSTEPALPFRRQALTWSGVDHDVEALDPYEQPPMCLSDFRVALEEYQPTLQKAAEQSAAANMPLASMMASIAELARANTNNHESHDGNKVPRTE